MQIRTRMVPSCLWDPALACLWDPALAGLVRLKADPTDWVETNLTRLAPDDTAAGYACQSI